MPAPLQQLEGGMNAPAPLPQDSGKTLTLTLDPNVRLLVEPGFKHDFSAAGLASNARALDPFSARALWNPPGTGIISLKPLQLFPEFINHQAQEDQGCLFRLLGPTSTPAVPVLKDFLVNPIDLVEQRLTEISVGSDANPWIQHAPATSIFAPPTKQVIGLAPLPFSLDLTPLASVSEVGLSLDFDTTPTIPDPAPNHLIVMAQSFTAEKPNQGLLFRWWVPAPVLTAHQHIYAFVFGQYCALCRGALLEVYEDTSTGGRRNAWTLRSRQSIFRPGVALDVNSLNPLGPLGKSAPELNDTFGHFASLMVLPIGRQKVL